MKNFFWLILLFCGNLFGQECDSTQWAQPGTYEVVIDSAAVEAGASFTPTILLSGEDLCFIESSRKPTQAVQIRIGAYLITVFPAKKIANSEIDE